MLRRRNKPALRAKIPANTRFPHHIIITSNQAINDLEPNKWQEFARCFALVSPLGDQRFIALENMNFGNIINEEYFLFKIRYIKFLQKNMYILFKKRRFEIKRIINEQEQDYLLTLVAIEV